jgi:hypothetical protein
MSILLVEVIPQGIIFGADRNVTIRRVVPQSPGTVGNTNINIIQEYRGQSQRPKVLRWPQRKALIGYVGEAKISGVPTDEWLYDFIGDNLNFQNFEVLSESLRLKVEEQRRIDEGNRQAAALIIHLGGFEERDGVQVPTIYVIRNVWHHSPTGYEDIRKEFQKVEAFGEAFQNTLPQEIRRHIETLASHYEPFWFHQGFDLGTFNVIEEFLKAAFRTLCEGSSKHSLPQSLQGWEQQVRMSILTYGAYFQAYKGPSEQFVGGGVDVVSIEWP